MIGWFVQIELQHIVIFPPKCHKRYALAVFKIQYPGQHPTAPTHPPVLPSFQPEPTRNSRSKISYSKTFIRGVTAISVSFLIILISHKSYLDRNSDIQGTLRTCFIFLLFEAFMIFKLHLSDLSNRQTRSGSQDWFLSFLVRGRENIYSNNLGSYRFETRGSYFSHRASVRSRTQ